MTGKVEAGKRRQYTVEERAAIFADATKFGVVEASRRHGVPQTTVSNWRNRDVKKSAAAAKRVIDTPTTSEATATARNDESPSTPATSTPSPWTPSVPPA